MCGCCCCCCDGRRGKVHGYAGSSNPVSVTTAIVTTQPAPQPAYPMPVVIHTQAASAPAPSGAPGILPPPGYPQPHGGYSKQDAYNPNY